MKKFIFWFKISI